MTVGRRTSSKRFVDLSVRVSIPKAILAILGATILFAPSVLLCLAPVFGLQSVSPGDSAFVVAASILGPLVPGLVGLAGVLFFGYALVFFLLRLILFWRPMLEIGSEGVLDRASAVAAGFVPWEEIEDAKMVNSYGQSFVGVSLRDERAFLRRQNPLKRLVMKVNRRYFTRAAINIPSTIMPVSPREILLQIRPHLDPPAQKRLDSSLPKQARRSSESNASTDSTPGREALGVVGALAGTLILRVLSGIYWLSCVAFWGVGVLVGLIALGLIEDYAFDPGTLAVSVIFIVLGVVDFVYVPRVVEKLFGYKLS